MSWTRLDDAWTERPVLSDLDYEARWHYLAMIQFCSRTGRVDGVMTRVQALRCSDVPDPERAVATLDTAGLLSTEAGGVRVVHIDEHIPPPSVRENTAQSKVRMQRHRKHKNGDHSMCLSEHCSEGVTSPVTRNTRTGQDGTGRASEGSVTKNVTEDAEQGDVTWPTVVQSGSSSSIVPTCPGGEPLHAAYIAAGRQACPAHDHLLHRAS